MHKAGFVNIVGLPNAGKSTIMNALIKEPLSIITNKAQTTRQRILGIINQPHYQIVFSDTPGIIKDPAYELHKKMISLVRSAFEDADIIMLVIAASQKKEIDAIYIDLIKKKNFPTIVVLNKVDLVDQKCVEELHQKWSRKLPLASIIPASALHNFNTDFFISLIESKLPKGPAYFSKEHLTDKTERFFAEEHIRKAILNHYKQEVPYNTLIEVYSYKEAEHLIKIAAYIYVSRESQKKIIIGYQGKDLKKIGTSARIDIEQFTKKKVFLELFVKVKSNWQNNDKLLKQFGFI